VFYPLFNEKLICAFRWSVLSSIPWMFNNSFKPKPVCNSTVVKAGYSDTCCPKVGFCREAQHRSAYSRCQQACHATARHISYMSTHVRSTRPRNTHRMWPSEDENRVQYNLAARKSWCRNYTAMLFYLATRIALYSVRFAWWQAAQRSLPF